MRAFIFNMYRIFSTNTHISIVGIKNKKHTTLEGREDENKNRKHCEQP